MLKRLEILERYWQEAVASKKITHYPCFKGKWGQVSGAGFTSKGIRNGSEATASASRSYLNAKAETDFACAIQHLTSNLRLIYNNVKRPFACGLKAPDYDLGEIWRAQFEKWSTPSLDSAAKRFQNPPINSNLITLPSEEKFAVKYLIILYQKLRQ